MQRTIKDVAKRAGSSPSTVSRVLNRSGYVSPETQRRVEEAATELGYHPNWLARGLKGKPSHLIGLIIPDISNTYYTAIAQAVTAELRAHNYEPILCVNNEDPLVDLHYLQILQQKRVDGILYAHPARGTHRAFVEELVRGGLPIVEINRQHAGDLLDAAVADNFRGAYQMTEYLIGMGHRRIGLILGEMELITGKNRLEGYRRAHQDAGLTVNPAYLCTGSFNRQYGEQATRQLAGPARAAHRDLRRQQPHPDGLPRGARGARRAYPGRHVHRRVRQFRMARHLAAPDHRGGRGDRGDRPPGRRAALASDRCARRGSRRGRRQADHLYFEHIPDCPGIVPTPTGVLIGRAGRRNA